MKQQKLILWTPDQRESVIEFLEIYRKQLEKSKDSPNQEQTIRQIQSGVLHLVDMVIPSGVSYQANIGPDGPIFEGVRVILTNEEQEELERERSGETGS